MTLLAIALLMAAQGPATITGKVTDALTHRPLPNVHVGATVESHFVGDLTAFDGSYKLEAVPAGKVRMNFNLDGYGLVIGNPTIPEAYFTIGAGEAVTRNVEMHPLGRIYGKLTDRDTGKPIEGHTVSALHKEHLPGHTSFAGRAGDAKGGAFDIRNLDPGEYVVGIDSAEEASIVLSADATAPKPGKFYGQRWYPDVPRREMATIIHLGEGETRNIDMAIESRETYRLSGTVEAPRDREYGGVTLTVDIPGAFGIARTRRIDMPGPGPFRIDNLAPGSYELAFTAGKKGDVMSGLRADGAAADVPIEVTDHNVENLRVVLAPSAGVAGEVRMLDEDGKLPAGIAALMVPTSGWFAQLKGGGMLVSGGAPMRAPGVTNGHFRQPLRPGEYWPQLMNLPDGYAVAQVLFAGAASRYSAMTLSVAETPLTFVLTSHPGAIAGVVRDGDGNPAGVATVILLPDPVPEKIGPAAILAKESGEDGSFAFRNLAPGMYRAVVLSGAELANEGDTGYLRERVSKADPIEVRPGQPVTVSLKR